MKYYKDDIVEVINLQGIPDCHRINVGERYYVTQDSCGGSDVRIITVYSAGYNFGVVVNSKNVALYSRPWYNTIKSLFK